MSGLDTLATALRDVNLVARAGVVRQLGGLTLEAEGPDVVLGEVCRVQPRGGRPPVEAEVVALRDGRVVLMPYGAAGSNCTSPSFMTKPSALTNRVQLWLSSA